MTVITDDQAARILADLNAGKSITPIEALRDYGCFRLAARIFDLRQAGNAIDSKMVTVADGRRVARYSTGVDVPSTAELR